MKKLKKLLLTTTLVVSALSLVACGNSNKEVADGVNEAIKVGVVGEKHEVWDFVQEKLDKDGFKIDIVTFTDYNQPNEALLSKDIDLNSFQHQIFLDNFNNEKNADLISIGDTILAPIGLYSNKIKDVSEIKENDKIAIPDDVTNGARSLKLLETAGFLKVKDVDFPTVKDIEENRLNLEIIPMDASQTARSLDDVTVSIINDGVAIDAGYIPTEDSIYLEPVDKNSKPYINIIVSRQEDKDNEALKKVVEAYQAEDTKEIIKESTKGSGIPAWDIEL